MNGRRISGLDCGDSALLTGQEVLALCEWGNQLASLLQKDTWRNVLCNDGRDIIVFRRESVGSPIVDGLVAASTSDEAALIAELNGTTKNVDS